MFDPEEAEPAWDFCELRLSANALVRSETAVNDVSVPPEFPISVVPCWTLMSDATGSHPFVSDGEDA